MGRVGLVLIFSALILWTACEGNGETRTMQGNADPVAEQQENRETEEGAKREEPPASHGAMPPASDGTMPQNPVKASDWWGNLCPPEERLTKKTDTGPAWQGSLSGSLDDSAVTVEYEGYVFQLPQGWDMKANRIYAGEEQAGRLESYVYTAEKPGYPSFLAENARLYHCETGYWTGGDARFYEAALPPEEEDGRAVTFPERHFQFFEYGPRQHQVYALIFSGKVDERTASEISRTFRLFPQPDDDGGPVSITLDADPRLRSPVTALIAPEEQRFTITFAEEMDRDSVEIALRRQGIRYGPDHQVRALHDDRDTEIPFVFQWRDGKTLNVSLSEDARKRLPYFAYLLTVEGAVTKAGKVLRETPNFWYHVQSPQQIVQVGRDGTTVKPLTNFTAPYVMEMLRDNRHVLLKRYRNYCECDVTPAYVYTLFDLHTGASSPVSAELATVYTGEGHFYADPRGFFYNGEKGMRQEPTQMGTSRINIGGYVHGAQFSRNGEYVLMAVGADKETVRDLDFIIYSVKDGAIETHKRALRGRIEENQQDSSLLPVRFYDNGLAAYTQMWDEELGAFRYYAYDWKSGTVEVWTPPVPGEQHVTSYLNVTQTSADGQFTVHYEAGLLKAGALADPEMRQYGQWLGPRNEYVYLTYEGDRTDRIKLVSYNAETRTAKDLAVLNPNSYILGTSSDGQYVYVVSATNVPD